MKTVLMIIAATFVLAACNTIDGFGKDMKKAGESIETAAKKK